MYLQALIFTFAFLLAHPIVALASPLKVLATTGMISDLVKEIGGPLIEVTALMGPGVDPHLYRATQGDLSRITQSDIVFYNGLHLEGKMVGIFEKLSKAKLVIAISSTIPIEKLRKPEEFEGNYDPHIWFDVKLWIEASKSVLYNLTRLLPEQRGEIEARHSAYLLKLQQLDKWITNEVGQIPKERRVLITAHDAFGYFGQSYGMEVIGLQGISTAAEFGLRDIVRIVDVIVERQIPALFVESSVPKRFVTAVQEAVNSKGSTVRIGGELYSDAMGATGTPEGTYIGMLQHNVNAIVGALS